MEHLTNGVAGSISKCGSITMKRVETGLPGVVIIEPEPISDARGFFARTWCRSTFSSWGLATDFSQCSLSFNRQKGIVRGMHFQHEPFAEVKLVRCIQGAILDVAIDIRPGSPTRFQSTAVELTASNRRALYIPSGFAHGFQTLEPNSEVLYQISGDYVASASSGCRFDDPAVRISWPLPVEMTSQRDRSWPDLLP
jgi:dTDP-4-dehydrorhamnose 3,5-epimerase